MTYRFRFLGSGGSMGVPVIGCKCEVCHSKDIKNKRTRPSGLLQVNGKKILIDVGPDFHTQALKNDIDHLDGVMLTHTHYDHIAGLDELRIYYYRQKKALPCLVSKETLEDLKLRYHYFFSPKEDEMHSAKLQFNILPKDFGEMEFCGLPIKYLSYKQAGMKVTGFRVGAFSYVTDIQEYSDDVIKALEGTKILVLSALRWTKSPVHFSLEEAINFAKKVGAEKTFFTHIAHDLDHEKTNQKLPGAMQLSYDGLEIIL